ncbi:hypothetical protein [Marinobacterium weihaiense]|uniref:Uncharacterized protein n=1 Tax=Marinobacterium weihaiense TaxID=2851016 RepID=A0ABS6MC98_9GAMM|nr:hypothetical protein [Marinobacterium weihaiense]MBV0933928.1 hypothetical protein [Marinobacterium weihaiense]
MKSCPKVFWLIWGGGVLPLLAAVLMWGSGIGIPSQGTNKGELLQPVQSLEQWGGQPQRHTGHWSLVWVPAGECLPVCGEQLERLRRIHDALGRNADRVRVMPEYSGLAPGVWVVDPLGNLVLKYPLAYEGQALLSDMRRLLKASRLG